MCRKDADDQQICTSSSQTPTSEASQAAASQLPEPVPAEDTSTGTHVTDPAPDTQQLPPVSSHKHETSSAPHSSASALAESELMAENVPEAVQRLTSADATASSSESAEIGTQSDSPALTSPTSLALPAADALNRSATQEDDSDSEYGLEFNPFSFVQTLPPLAEVIPKHQKPLLPPQTRRFKKKTLVLDLDETLVSCLTQSHTMQHEKNINS